MTLSVAQQVATRKLTDKQEKLLSIFFRSKGKKELSVCAEEAGYAEPNEGKKVIRTLREEIISLTEMLLIESAPSAVHQIRDILMSDEKIMNVNAKLDAAKTILDRAGLGKQDKVSVDVNHTGGIFVLPSKTKIQEEAIEGEYTDE